MSKRRASDDDEEPASDHDKLARASPVQAQTYFCMVPSCGVRTPFGSAELASHHRQRHAHICHECRKTFPDEHFLSLHLTERHDTMTMLKRERGDKTFACFQAACKHVSQTPKQREVHLIEEHQYPRDFLFSLPLRGMAGRQSLLRGQQ
ncbi:uncharacterized protein L969DRAFT_95952 [Mixia osmundae IAM 14324]|uniref:C2H2-type domain-containing protein n=1 Tax=Mixia osmundae (strain CBS 9802 / IAM 14324 / JCM 22182 / KY 12970) TaxID=764103 RepID=G7DWX7_MIXOS|nr:uncharacterized protein L969DRAFT_95952 [Mixia osmundae IAM 14324]KEI38116.1 hypothetical protein L969DRAFT_95952 [Mixia osmundae IAM 14324]GAA95074.1 hypothetical protein E5Q_01729 [Mixia osmundae IAM 14324]